MAVRQYIGARYVPKFYDGNASGTWDSGVMYEPLTLVQWATNTYCSKKTVPATIGSPNLNPEYWANVGVYGNVTADVTQLKTDVNSLDTDVTQLKTNVNSLNTDVTQLKTDVNPLNTDVTQLKTDVSSLNTDVTQLKIDVNSLNTDVANLKFKSRNKKYLFVGDSYGAGYTPDGNVTGWPTIVAENLGLESSDYSIIAVSGGGISYRHPNDYYIPHIIQEANIANPETFTDVIICCGRNDIDSTMRSGLDSGFSALYSAVSTKLPNADIKIGFIGSDFNITEYTDTKGADLYATLMMYCVQKGYLAGVENILANKRYMSSDGKHPNQNGQNALGKFIANAIRNGSCSIAYGGHEISATVVNGASGFITWAEKIKDGFVTVYPCYGNSAINFAKPITHTFNFSSAIKICDNIQFDYYVPLSSTQSRFPVHAQFNLSDGSYISAPCWIDVSAARAGVNEAWLGGVIMNDAHNNYLTASITSITLTEASTVNKYWIG